METNWAEFVHIMPSSSGFILYKQNGAVEGSNRKVSQSVGQSMASEKVGVWGKVEED